MNIFTKVGFWRRIAPVLVLCLFGCGIQIRPLRPALPSGVIERAAQTDPRVVFRFFDEDFVSGGYAYNYPEASKVFVPEESGRNGEVAVEFDLEAADYSGGAVCLYNLLYDLDAYYQTGALQFWIKGAKGGEVAWVALVDDEASDGKKTVVRLPLTSYGGIRDQWRQITVPLRDFGRKGVFWDAKKSLELPESFDWNAVAEFRLEIKKGDNKEFRVWVDDIFILRDAVQPSEGKQQLELWEDRKEEIPALPAGPAVAVQKRIFANDPPAAYVYGGKTSYALKKDIAGKNDVLVCYMDNEDYSGVTLVLDAGDKVDMGMLRKAKSAGIGFWARSNAPLRSVFLGVVDVENQDLKVQTKLGITDFGAIDTAWRYFMVPVRKFLDKGKYWDAGKQAELVGDMNWKNIAEFRFSTNKGENALPTGEPVVLYVDDFSIIDSIPGYVDPDEYWAEFTSDKPDIVLHDFETPQDQQWEAAKGEQSEASFKMVPADAPSRGKQSMTIDYKLADYCDIMYEYPKNNVPAEKRDWSRHWGLKFDFYTTKAYQPVSVQVNDAGNEIFIASTGGGRGWNTLLVPFKSFSKFPYWQPPDAVQNGRFDLESVVKIDFKPAGDGSSGSFTIDNVALTNDREVKRSKAADVVAVTVVGSLSDTLVRAVPPGVFGINAALWDGDLLKQQTVDYVKPVRHAVIRYPGGLRADEDHWEQVLSRKDWNVDIDEFFDFCRKTGTEPMITVNFGKGTPEEAAAWVRHCNVNRRAKVRYWEVGNELYGDWHPNHCTGDAYGKRAADFIKAMKAVDPSILVSVVWVLDGEWNRQVFEHTRDLADAVSVHHYSQHTGEENDAGLLAAPQSLPEIIGNVRAQMQRFGTASRKYEVWLSEWNSVDFKPGPQTLSNVNAVFVADYLGMLAALGVEQASYWDIHNDMTEQGGDYGYLSRTGAPDGDNTPRPSYWSFKLASDALRGVLLKTSTDDGNVSAYLSVDKGVRRLMIVNKYPQSRAKVKTTIDGFAGPLRVRQLAGDGWGKGVAEKTMDMPQDRTFEVPPYSVTVIEPR